MKTIYGLHMITAEDVIYSVGARSAICNNIKAIPGVLDMFDDFEKFVVDTSIGIGGNFPTYNILQPYQFIFIAVDLLEERLIYEELIAIEKLKDNYIMTLSRREKIDRMLEKYHTIYEKYSSKYAADATTEEPCFTFAVLENKITEVFVSTPSAVIKFLQRPTIYACEVCGVEKHTDNTAMNGFLPEMYYTITDDNTVHYVCKEHKGKEYRAVGE